MTQAEQDIVQTIAAEVRRRLGGDGSGHDWWHVFRVWNTARTIGAQEHADMFVVELAALLHDVADWKYHNGDESVGPRVAREIMQAQSVDAGCMDHVCDIIATISFKGAGVQTPMKTLEGKVVQDADRLDAMGAMGIARAFAYGGHKNRALYDPDNKPTEHMNKEQYFSDNGSTINHFYEKLLLLKDRMNTDAARALAAERHIFMQQYLERFFKEWNGEM